MMIDKVIEPDTLRVTPQGVTLNLRLPWYRGLPLSVVELDGIVVDGQQIPLDQVTFSVNGKSWPVSKLLELVDETWFVLDSATLAIFGLSAVRGQDYSVEVALSLYPPYIRGVRRAFRWTRTMKAN